MIYTKIRANRHILYLLALFIMSGCSKTVKQTHENNGAPKNTVLLISIDGFRWDYFEKAVTPNFDKFIKSGVRAQGLIPPFPSKTFPSHISMVTGRYPEGHGIVANTMFDSIFNEYYYIGENSKPVLDGKWYEAEPVWVTAEKQGKKAMTMFWPASEAEIMGVRPTEYFVYNESITHSERIDQIVKWLDYPDHKRGNFFSLYFSEIDSRGHQYGPNSAEVISAVEAMDATIGDLIDKLQSRKIYDDVNIIIASDHGMADISQDSVIFLDDYINLDEVEIIDWGPACAILPKVNIDKIFSELVNAHPMLDVYKKGDLPSELNYNNHRRIQPIIAIAKEHWSISDRNTYNREPYIYNGGTHGYYSSLESMRGVFIARGPGFKKNFIGPGFANIHLYELMCHLLKIEPVNNDGLLDSTSIYLSNNIE